MSGGGLKWSLKNFILEMGQLSINTLVILLGEGPSCALSAGKMQEVFNHMRSALFCSFFYINTRNYSVWIKKGGKRGCMRKRRGVEALPEPLTLLWGLVWMWYQIPRQCLALVLLLLILSLLGPGRAGQQFTGPSVILTIIGRIYAGNKGDWSFNTSAQEK